MSWNSAPRFRDTWDPFLLAGGVLVAALLVWAHRELSRPVEIGRLTDP